VSYTAADGRQQLLDTLGSATDSLAAAIASLSEAYEHLDERSADELESALFAPVQAAYGRARRTHAEFSRRHGLGARSFAPAAQAAPSRGVKELIETATEAVGAADATLATLQDSMLPVEVGDEELRAGLAQVRTQLGAVPSAARELVRRFGR
jgi:hypothetical protein